MLGVQRSSMVMRRLTYHSRSITRGTKEKLNKSSSSSFGKSAIALGIGAAAFGSFGIATFAAGRWESPPPPPPSSSNGNAPPRSPPRSGGNNRRNRSSSSGDGSAFGPGLKVVGFGALVALGAFLVSRYRICQPNELCCLWCNHVWWWTQSRDGRWYVRIPHRSRISIPQSGTLLRSRSDFTELCLLRK